jgi:hypothetical protein
MGAEQQAQSPASTPERAQRAPSVESVPFAGTLEQLVAPTPASLHPTRPLNPTSVLRLQRSHGNTFVGQTLRRTTLLRHPAGFTPSADPEQAAQEINSPPPLTGSPEASAPTESGGEGATPEAAPATDAVPAADGGAPSPADAGSTGAPAAPTTPATAPATPVAMDLAKAKEVLTKSFGSVHTIVPGNIVLLADRAACWKKYDEINKGRNNPHTNAAWVDGDAQRYIPGLEGFADNGTVYVNQQTPLVTATAHEMLHNNTAADYRGAVGETINEGSTEYLALKACRESGISTSGGAVAYPDQVAFVTKLIGVVTEATLISAYFGGSATLINAFNDKQGPDIFAKMKPFAEARNYTEAEKYLQPVTARTKIGWINAILDSWWVDDDDIEQIRRIVNMNPSDRPEIARAIQPRISELWSIGQRTQLRVILGTV